MEFQAQESSRNDSSLGWFVCALGAAFLCQLTLAYYFIPHQSSVIVAVLVYAGFLFLRHKVAWGAGGGLVIGYFLLVAFFVPKVPVFTLNPYIEAVQDKVRKGIAEHKERHGRYPEEAAAQFREVLSSFGLSQRRAAAIEKRPLEYNPADGKFSIELF